MSNAFNVMSQPAGRNFTNLNAPASRPGFVAGSRRSQPIDPLVPFDETNRSTPPRPSICAGSANIHDCFRFVAGMASVTQPLGFRYSARLAGAQ